MSPVTAIGTAAAVCTTVSFVPQLLRMRRHGSRDLSYGMLALYFVGVSLWLLYGWLIQAAAVIGANAATVTLVAICIAYKWYRERPDKAPSARRRIAIDMDEVIADSLSEHLRRCEVTLGRRFTRDELHGFDIEQLVMAHEVEAVRSLLDAAFFADLAVVPGSQEVIRALAERHEVFIASAAMDVPASFDAKFRWLTRHFPFIPPSHIVFCGDKSVLDVDDLIDDSPRHFARFRGRGILFSAPHNRGETRYTRVHDWEDVRRLYFPDAPSQAPRELAAAPSRDAARAA